MNITDEQPDKVNEELERIKAEINKQKEGIIRKKLKELGLLYKLKHSKERRFKKIMIEVDEDFEHVFVDNNTIEGLRVVSFAKPDPKIEGSELSMDIKYF